MHSWKNKSRVSKTDMHSSKIAGFVKPLGIKEKENN